MTGFYCEAILDGTDAVDNNVEAEELWYAQYLPYISMIEQRSEATFAGESWSIYRMRRESSLLKFRLAFLHK